MKIKMLSIPGTPKEPPSPPGNPGSFRQVGAGCVRSGASAEIGWRVDLVSHAERTEKSSTATGCEQLRKKQCDYAGIIRDYCDLGEKLITDHCITGGSILIGPMLSHLLGNLVLRELDSEFSESLPVKYFRYVDDIVLVGEAKAVAQFIDILRLRLDSIGLNLHDDSSPKNIEVSTAEWLKGRNDFRESRRMISWMSLIGDLKRFLLFRPNERGILQEAFCNEGFRLPIRDYTTAIYEHSFLERTKYLLNRSWFRKNSSAVSINSLLNQAKWLREIYESEFNNLIDGIGTLSGFDRKRRVPKLRYRAGRLIYLSTNDSLASLFPIADELPELHSHAKIMETIAIALLYRL